MAEVLITLGIIGVVAAITLPTLIQNYQKQVYVNQFKKVCSTLQQGINMAMVQEGVSKLSDTCFIYNYKTCTSDKQDAEFKKYFNVINELSCNHSYPDYINYTTLYGNDNFFFSRNAGYILSDGSIIYNGGDLATGDMYQYRNMYGLLLYVDVNGTKGPNKAGRDLFLIVFANNGKMYPVGSNFANNAMSGTSQHISLNENGIETNAYDGQYFDCDAIQFSFGTGCAARIIQNGWQMDY